MSQDVQTAEGREESKHHFFISWPSSIFCYVYPLEVCTMISYYNGAELKGIKQLMKQEMIWTILATLTLIICYML